MSIWKSKKLYAVTLAVFGFAAYFLFSPKNQTAVVQGIRERMLSQFTATGDWIVFPVALTEETAALAVINRTTGDRKLVISPDKFLAFPQFSSDGKRVLVVRGRQTAPESELLSCNVEDWSCRVLVKASQPMRWPVEVRKDVVLYVGSESFGTRGHRHYDFYLAEASGVSVRMSNFELYDLAALSVIDDKVIFSSAGSLARNNFIFPNSDPLARASSEIFVMKINWIDKRFIVPLQQLVPLYLIGGFSVLATATADGTKVAFLNQRMTAGMERYNLVIGTIDGGILNYVDAVTRGFSRPAFVGADSVLVNQIFSDRYEVALAKIGSNSIQTVATFDHTSNALNALKYVQIRAGE